MLPLYIVLGLSDFGLSPVGVVAISFHSRATGEMSLGDSSMALGTKQTRFPLSGFYRG